MGGWVSGGFVEKFKLLFLVKASGLTAVDVSCVCGFVGSLLLLIIVEYQFVY